MEVEEEKEESKIEVPHQEIPKKENPLRDEKEIQHKHWEVNLRDKLNLKNYTKRYYGGKSKSKPKKINTSIAAIQNLHKNMKPADPDRLMKDIGLDKNFELDYPELLTKYEFPAV